MKAGTSFKGEIVLAVSGNRISGSFKIASPNVVRNATIAGTVDSNGAIQAAINGTSQSVAEKISDFRPAQGLFGALLSLQDFPFQGQLTGTMSGAGPQGSFRIQSVATNKKQVSAFGQWRTDASGSAGPLTPAPQANGPVQILGIENAQSVRNGATVASTFTAGSAIRVLSIRTYHWNNGRGRVPGTIALRAESGQIHGPWRANGLPGSGGVQNAYWIVAPGHTIPPGQYTVMDSDPSTWSTNDAAGRRGMFRIEWVPATELPQQTSGPPRASPQPAHGVNPFGTAR